MGTVPDVDAMIRPERPDDFDAIDRVVTDAFASPAEAELVREIRASTLYRPDMTLVALVDDVVVGHVMLSGAEVRGENTSDEVAMLSPLAVAPNQQRKGIGAALVRSACAVADHHDETMVLLQGDPAYYGRFGFVASAEHGITMKLPDWAPPEAAQLLRLGAWDANVRGHLVLPSAFDDID